MFFDKDLKPVNEVYFGKTPELQAIEKQLDVFRNKYMGKYTLNPRVNNDPELLKFDRMMEDYFGFGCFTLKIINERIVNGCTLPISYRYDVIKNDKNLIVDKKGFKFKKEADYAAIIISYSGIIFNPNFTTEEVMAMIMHEVGHNFAAALNHKVGIMLSVFAAINFIIDAMNLNIIYLVISSNSALSWITKLMKKTREKSGCMSVLVDTVDLLNSFIYNGLYLVSDIVKVLSLGISDTYSASISVLNTIKNPIDKIIQLIALPTGFRDERVADNFATIYGYGPATVSLQSKFESSENDSASLVMNAVNKVPLLGALINLNSLPALLILTAFDEHPAGVDRGRDQLALLKREVAKDDLDPKMKKVILSDIKACENKIQKIYDTSKGIQDPYISKHYYNKFLMNFDKTFKTILLDDKSKFDEYDRKAKDNYLK